MKLTDARSLVQVILPEARVSVRRTWSCYGAGWQKSSARRRGLESTGTQIAPNRAGESTIQATASQFATFTTMRY